MIRILCRIRALRKEKDLTQEELADKLGISRQSIISVESGKSLPSLSLALQIADLFEKTVEEIFIFSDNQKVTLIKTEIRRTKIIKMEKKK